MPGAARAPAPSRKRAPPIQPGREFGENKSKEMKAKLLSFVFICFSESGLFKGLRAKKVKKFGPRLTRLPGCAQPSQSPLFLLSLASSQGRQPGAFGFR